MGKKEALELIKITDCEGLRVSDLRTIHGCSEATARWVRHLVSGGKRPTKGRTPSSTAVDILVIPDAHSEPGEDLRRFLWLGKEARRCAKQAAKMGRRFYLVSIGDFADVGSLSSWDKGKSSGENRRYKDDCEANWAALQLVDQGLGDMADTVEKIITLGNHENRIARFANDNPALPGTIEAGQDLGFLAHGWKVVPFLEPLEIAGVNFIHYMPGKTGRALAGVHLARSLATKMGQSVVVGHSHEYQHAVIGRPLSGMHCHGLVVGAYFEHMHEYAGITGHNTQWHGLVLLSRVEAGDFDAQPIRLETLKERWS